MAQRIDQAEISPVIARKIAARASGANEAIVVGTRAGVIEWANAAWSRVTGYAVDDAVSKPIGWLLEAADIEPSVVDFVQRNFLSGHRCEVEFPVTTPDDRPIWLHLEVEPFRDSLGEISDFVAVATDITTRRAGEIALESRIQEALAESESDVASRAPDLDLRERAEADIALLEPRLALARITAAIDRAGETQGEKSPTPVLDEVRALALQPLADGGRAALDAEPIDLTRCAAAVCVDRARSIPFTLAFDPQLDASLPGTFVDRQELDALVGDLIDTAIDEIGGEWGTLSLTTGVAEPGLALSSTVDPTIDRFPLQREKQHVFLEIHDTALSLSRASLSFIKTRGGEKTRAGEETWGGEKTRSSERPHDARTLSVALASARAERLGGTLRVHSVPGVGTRVILYLPVI